MDERMPSVISNESRLLSLPPEIFGKIFERFMVDHGLDPAMQLRFVCRTFSNEVLRTVCRLEYLEDPWPANYRYQHPNLALEYLLSKFKGERAIKYHITRLIDVTVNSIIEEMPDLQPRREEFMRGLCWCLFDARYKYMNKIDDVLNDDDELTRVNEYVDRRRNMLAAAAYLGITALVQRLVDRGVEDKGTRFGYPLNCAVAGGNLDVIRLLRDRKFVLSHAHYPNFLPSNHGLVLRILCEPAWGRSGPRSPESPGHISNVAYAIMRAVAIGDSETVTYLLGRAETYGRKYELLEWFKSVGGLYDSMLWIAAHHGHMGLVQHALQNDASVDRMLGWSIWGIRGVVPGRRITGSPLDAAAKSGHWEIVRLLLDTGAKATSKALAGAAKAGWLLIAQTLADEGASVWPCWSGSGQMAFVEIVERGNLDMVRLFLEHGFAKERTEQQQYITAYAYNFARKKGMHSIMKLIEAYGFQPK
ncbi:ankyrin [Lindgomyces ingoldianus]|uniref:Ankyrin n=1 Tax=Lindgomyces ingoldianus TaxID=673940 RepID=A0ACB6QX59_9PLEO|nr:ankyrin [Lindgomyces ingoldianus]KAF2471461.1 ankyrin [Lindgomyces ingoldianus]